MKICLSCQSGGHLDQLLRLSEAYEGHEIVLVTESVDRVRTLQGDMKTYLIPEYPRHIKHFESIYVLFLIPYYLSLIPKVLKIILNERPDIIIANGGEATLYLAYIGKILGIKIIYIESLTRVHTLSGTGKLVYPVADLFLVQWENLTRKYSKARFWGRVL
jgi:beta-1,4-N-acetylglucosaminyltransferase